LNPQPVTHSIDNGIELIHQGGRVSEVEGVGIVIGVVKGVGDEVIMLIRQTGVSSVVQAEAAGQTPAEEVEGEGVDSRPGHAFLQAVVLVLKVEACDGVDCPPMNEDRCLSRPMLLPRTVDRGDLVNVELGGEAMVMGQGGDRIQEVVASHDPGQQATILERFEDQGPGPPAAATRGRATASWAAMGSGAHCVQQKHASVSLRGVELVSPGKGLPLRRRSLGGKPEV
jgi:hypothetical protein